MAVQINPPNFAGLASLASSNGNLNLQNPGALGLQGLQLSQQQQASLRDAALQQMQLRQQGEIALRQQQNQQSELAQQRQYQQGLLSQSARGQDIQMQGQKLDATQNANQLGFQQQQLAQQGALGQGQLDLEKQKLAQDQMAKEMAKLMDEKKEKLEEKGAYAAYGLMTMQSAKTPAEAQMYKTEIINEAVDKGYVDKDVGDALRKAPNSQFINVLTHQTMMYDGVSKYKAMMDANKDTSKKAGTKEIYDPETGNLVYSSTPTVGTINKAQEAIITKDLATDQLEQLEKGFKPEYFTDKSQLDAWVSGQAERKKGLPVLEQATEFLASTMTGKTPKQREAFISERKQYFNKVDQLYNTYKKEITGQAAGEKELDQIKNSFINGEMSPSEFKGALEQVVSKYKSETDYNKDVLNKGINTAPAKTYKWNPATGTLE